MSSSGGQGGQQRDTDSIGMVEFFGVSHGRNGVQTDFYKSENSSSHKTWAQVSRIHYVEKSYQYSVR